MGNNVPVEESYDEDEDEDMPSYECPACFAKEWSKDIDANNDTIYVCCACGQVAGEDA